MATTGTEFWSLSVIAEGGDLAVTFRMRNRPVPF